jgi:5'-methylthioadenosine phosphorylase
MLCRASSIDDRQTVMAQWKLGVIGGSGLYQMDGLSNQQWLEIASPWGAPSSPVLSGRIGEVDVVFLPRHGTGHSIPPSAINARANIDVLKRAGCTDILSISAVGSLQAHLPPGSFAIVDQFIDWTRGRVGSFFDGGLVAHVSMAEPVCPRLASLAAQAARTLDIPHVTQATYLAMEGPQFSSRAESRLYRSWGCDVIGMTGVPEAKLAREAELPYASVCMVTDYDAWRVDEAAVDVAGILEVMHANAAAGQALVAELVRQLPDVREASPIDTCLDLAILGDPANGDARLSAILARRLGKSSAAAQ